MPARTFKLSDDEVETIKRIAERDGISQTEVIRRAIANLDKQRNTNESTEVVGILKEQVKSLKEQVEFLENHNLELIKIIKIRQQAELLTVGNNDSPDEIVGELLEMIDFLATRLTKEISKSQ